MTTRYLFVLGLVAAVVLPGIAAADNAVNKAMKADLAFAKYGLTGKKVIVAILDRGIDYTHGDFRNADGTTRIRKMWDMSNVNTALPLCDPAQPAPIVYTSAQINQALTTGLLLAERDAVGHGTVSTALAAGNGLGLAGVGAQWAGVAPKADLLIVKMTSEGAPAHSGQLAEAAFQSCMSVALDLVTQEATALGEPMVALMNSGTQWGPIDNSGAVSQKINADFSAPGRVYVAASGDEGSLPNHARTTFNATPGVLHFNKAVTAAGFLQLWYTGAAPANVTLTIADNGATATAGPNACVNSADSSITVCNYLPGQQFYPWKSSGPDRAVWMRITGHSGAGTISIVAPGGGNGTADAYGDAATPTPVDSFTDHLVPGRLTDYSSTLSALVAGCFNVRTAWTDLNGQPRTLTNQGAIKDLWLYSSGGPTRDGRSPLTPTYGGVDIATPGGNAFAAYSPTSYWGDTTLFAFNMIQGGNGLYGRHSATSASAPLAVGAVALLLQINPKLTTTQIRQFIHQSAIGDGFTHAVPNLDWGTGKLNLLGAADLAAATLKTNPALSTTTLTFPARGVGTTSPAMNVTFSNLAPAKDALPIASIKTSGDFAIAGNTCGSKLKKAAQCVLQITFKPTQTGPRTGSLTIKDFNPGSPHVVTLSGSGQ